MMFYHYTTLEAVEAILRDGFQDREGYYDFVRGTPLKGVWVSDIPLDVNDTSRSYKHEAWLRLTVKLPQSIIDGHEVVYGKGGFGYREWLFPAGILNAHALMELYDPFVEEAE